MMNFQIKTPISKDYKTVYSGFDQKLFEFLLPPKMVAQLVSFGGSTTGDLVHIQFLFPVKTEWISEITYDEVNDKECFFIDEGRKLPFGVKNWKHKHIVRKDGDSCVIVDDITYGYSNKLLDVVFYPFWYFSFLPRKRQYKKYFEKLS